MTKKSRVGKSRDCWKEKAKIRSSENCELRKAIFRLEETLNLKEIQRIEEIQQLTRKIENHLLLSNATNTDHPKEVTQKLKVLCVQLIIVGIISFRSVPRILKLIGNSVGLKQDPPHFTSVINWNLRAGIAILNDVEPTSEPWVAIIDISNTIGTRKILVVLRVLLKSFIESKGAITLENAECIGIASNDVWDGDNVKSILQQIFAKTGKPSAILKDGGPDLQKGVRLLCESETKNIIIIDDVGHWAANALKAEYKKDPDFIKFLEIITTGAAKIRQTKAAWALPPKIRTKGRFQGITKVADWAKSMLLIIDDKSSDLDPKQRELLLTAFSGLVALRSFIEKFIFNCDIVEQFLKLMKNDGLNKKTMVTSIEIINELPFNSKVKQKLLKWLSNHKQKYLKLKLRDHSLLVSSDIIESLFGKFKLILERSPQAELNRLIYVIPLLCKKRTDHEIATALEKYSHTEMQKFIIEKIPTTIRQQRMKLLKKTKKRVPNLRNYKSALAA